MPRRSLFTSLRARVVALVALAVLPALGLILSTATRQQESAKEDAQMDSLRVAKLASASQTQLFDSARQLLVALSHLPEFRSDDPTAAEAFLAKLLDPTSPYFNFGVINADGSVFASAMPTAPSVNLGDRSYFRGAMETENIAIGDYQVGRITKRASINIGCPIADPATGRPYRVVYAAIDLSWIETLAARAALPQGATLAVVDAQGVVLAGWPDVDRLRGEPIKNPEALRMVARGTTDTDEIISSTTGEPLLIAFAPLQSAETATRVSVIVSIPKRVALAEATATLWANLFWLATVSLLAIAAAWFGGDVLVLRQVRAILAATRKVAAGDLSARTGRPGGTSELGQLAEAFDRMTVALQERSAERDQAELKLKMLNEQLEQRVIERTLQLHQKSEQLEADLDLAREFQANLLPRHAPLLLPGTENTRYNLQLAHRYEPSGAVGGDFFEILPISPTESGIFVCDVMGHGVRAALMAAIIRGLTEQLKGVAGSPDLFLAELNNALVDVLQGTGTTIFATAAYAVIDIQRKEIRYVNAGHSKPLHLRRRTGTVTPLQPDSEGSNPVLGLFRGTEYAMGHFSVEEGDGVLIYTDGVFEVSSSEHEEFGEQRLREAIQRRVALPLDKIFTEVVGEIHEFSSGGFDDDVCIVGVEVTLK